LKWKEVLTTRAPLLYLLHKLSTGEGTDGLAVFSDDQKYSGVCRRGVTLGTLCTIWRGVKI
jgi:hypothetical protein